MRKGNGGIIGPQNRTTSTVAAGIWSMDEQQQSLGARNWPGTPAATVPNAPSFANSATFTASISTNVMTVSAIASGALAVGQVISGTDVPQYATITAQLTGSTGSTGTYTISIASASPLSSRSMSSTVVLTTIVTATSSVQIPFITGYDGGSPITGVTATIYNGPTVAKTVTGTTSPLTATLLPNSTVYSVTLTATNAIGTSTASTGPYFKTPAVPNAPTIGTATLVGTNGATVSFTPSTDNNGSTITNYTAVSSPGGITASSTTSPISFSGLGNTTSYTFTVYATNAIGNGASSSASNSITTGVAPVISYLIIGGGAGGSGGGGGAGQVRSGTFSPSGTYTVTVGAGSAGNNVNNAGYINPSNGNSSSAFGFTAIGGGGGGANSQNGSTGASGGGGGPSAGTVTFGGTGSAGNNGGGNGGFFASIFPAGGGGGAGAAGGAATSLVVSGNGGNGTASSITGASVNYGGGGGGGSYNNGTAGTGGTGGGGNGGSVSVATAGTANTGGGGGGENNGRVGASGGSGVVIVSSPSAAAGTTGSPTVTTSGGNTIYTFTGSGSITF